MLQCSPLAPKATSSCECQSQISAIASFKSGNTNYPPISLENQSIHWDTANSKLNAQVREKGGYVSHCCESTHVWEVSLNNSGSTWSQHSLPSAFKFNNDTKRLCFLPRATEKALVVKSIAATAVSSHTSTLHRRRHLPLLSWKLINFRLHCSRADSPPSRNKK